MAERCLVIYPRRSVSQRTFLTKGNPLDWGPERVEGRRRSIPFSVRAGPVFSHGRRTWKHPASLPPLVLSVGTYYIYDAFMNHSLRFY